MPVDRGRHRTPRVWVLLGAGAGGNAQMIALAEALGWPYQTRQLSWNAFNHLPNPVIGARAFTLDREADALQPPWPDLVIAASRRSAPIARWIKKQSGGNTKLVHLLHTQMPLHHFDLVVTLAQFRVPEAANVQRNTLPLNVIDGARKAEAAERWRGRLACLPRPWIAVLVGGDSSSYTLDAATAARLGREAARAAHEAGGGLLITTSKRTPAAAADALIAAIDCPAEIYRWRADDADNPYPAFLALADRFIVTGDSASLAAEAVATGRPVRLFEWPAKRPARRLSGLAGRLHRGLVYAGWRKPRRDFAAFHARLRDAGLVDAATPAPVPDDMGATVVRIRALMGYSASASDRPETTPE
ncbi:mitochondrial fission ELM1 family protein [Salinisphaera sp.]|uniref:mitochondrial fission ELM1 family protein n=1 Tax=Salinisphaera sp. TaxID=1914330 RepID=UPI002D79B2BB|nr:ELM1/GtrOC1 family putative glycosyltransferase [Salinisphaera sp.]HET7313160.1 ELM1/GtrOC1 family putative glycosyltransferase [Salinisphaera sp.]